MLRGHRRGWIRRYAALMQALLADDMYGKAQKVLAVPTYGLLPFMPRRWRVAWLDRTKGMGRIKGVIQSVLHLTRFKPRRPDEKPAAAQAHKPQPEPSV